MKHRADSETFLRLLKPHQHLLELCARRMLRNPSQAEDILQEAVLEAWAHFTDFTLGTNFKAWIFRFLTHKILNANRRVEPLQLGEIPAELAADEEWDLSQTEVAFELLLTDPDRVVELLDQPLSGALERLSAAERACLLLKSIGEFSYHEIHQLIDIPVGSVMGYLARSRRRMRLFLLEPSAKADERFVRLAEVPQAVVNRPSVAKEEERR
ncbi:MAG: RNA polymerase sigma factor [Planctomycetota bacterium]